MPRKKKIETPTANVWGKIITGDVNEYLPLFEFAKQLKLKEEYLIGLAKSGRLKAFKLDDYWLSTSQWVNEWLEEVKSHLEQEISQEETAVITALPQQKKATSLRSAKPKATPIFYRDPAEIRRELLEELAKEAHPQSEEKWVHYDNNSFLSLLNTPLKLSLAPRQISYSYSLILGLCFILIAGLFICTTVLAGL